MLYRTDADRDVFNEKPSKEELMAATQVWDLFLVGMVRGLVELLQ